MEHFRFKKRVAGEPLDIVKATPWVGTAAGCFSCAYCRESDMAHAYDITVEWGDTRVYEELDWMCEACGEKVTRLGRNTRGQTLHDISWGRLRQ